MSHQSIFFTLEIWKHRLAERLVIFHFSSFFSLSTFMAIMKISAFQISLVLPLHVASVFTTLHL